MNILNNFIIYSNIKYFILAHEHLILLYNNNIIIIITVILEVGIVSRFLTAKSAVH